MDIKRIKKIAECHGWRFVDHQQNIGMISFIKTIDDSPARINIYLTKMTVSTSLNHPKQGKTQMFRKKVNDKLMEELFINPRTHTDKGYKKR